MSHPDMIETAPPRNPRTRKPKAPHKKPKATSRPTLGKRAVRGLRAMLAAMPPSAYLHDADMTAAVRYLALYLEWHQSPEITAKRHARGQAIKQWAARQAQTPQA